VLMARATGASLREESWRRKKNWRREDGGGSSRLKEGVVRLVCQDIVTTLCVVRL
jgi:hypothetical protein